MSPWTVSKTLLSPPPLQELVPIITAGLQSNFANVSVELTACPNLRLPPFHLAAPGLSGNERIADIGGQSNLAPVPKLDRKYSLLEMTKLMEMPPAKGFILGAGAGPFHVLGLNSELMPNLSYERGGEVVRNLTHYAKVDEQERCVCERMENVAASTDCGLMANLFGCDGEAGDVLKIVVSTRTGPVNFTDTVRNALKAEYGEQPISLGGVFVIRKGGARLHVMPDFPETPFRDRKAVEEWLRYFDMVAPLVCLSVLHSCDPGLDLRMEHTHCFSQHGEGGHYHDDTTPGEVEYEAYFNLARAIYRIDRPEF